MTRRPGTGASTTRGSPTRSSRAGGPAGTSSRSPAARHQSAQLALETEWTLDRLQPNDLVNQLRSRLDLWRRQGRPYLTTTTRALLDYWRAPERDRRLFFAQVEAAETAIYLVEAAVEARDTWVADQLRQPAAEANPGLVRTALKMATGSGKTTVMGMPIAWQTGKRGRRRRAGLHRPVPGRRPRHHRQAPTSRADARRPGQRLPRTRPGPAGPAAFLRRAIVVVTNFHAFGLRETREGKGASKTTKQVLDPTGTVKAFTETPAQMVSQVCPGVRAARPARRPRAASARQERPR